MMEKYTLKEDKKRKYHHNGTLSKTEVMAILILFHGYGYRCMKHFLTSSMRHPNHLLWYPFRTIA